MPCACASLTTASASGCSLSRSTAPTSRRSSASSTPGAVMTSMTAGSPRVSVPVLSNTTACTFASSSSAMAVLKRMPRRAPRPVPTITAIGVASPRASGHGMTTTVIANSSDSCAEAPAAQYQTAKVARPPSSATSTSQKAAWSARRWPGALDAWASWTSLTICASAVSEPTAVARARRVPVLLIVAPTRGDPGPFGTGMFSPVTVDSSTSPVPSITSASTGTFAPGRIRAGRRRRPPPSAPSSTGSPFLRTSASGARGPAARGWRRWRPPRARHLEPVAQEHERGQQGGGLIEDLASIQNVAATE